ncbi:MAG TPA: adenosine-specific kinase, partial [Candidatus Wallbacteria bacterium]|nr:adenosine-specific kinase [Candidatus Wallbacteria bacterium]
MKNPEGLNFIFGQSHFIKTIEDLYEILITSSTAIKFGIAFSEASGPCLIRKSGNDEGLINLACENLMQISCGHTFIIFMKDAFPINVLNQIKNCQEVVRIFCASANPVYVLKTSNEQGGGVVGVIDGYAPKGIET